MTWGKRGASPVTLCAYTAGPLSGQHRQTNFSNPLQRRKCEPSSPANCCSKITEIVMNKLHGIFWAFAFALLLVVAQAGRVSRVAAEERSIVVAATTSTQDPGFFDYILPIVKERTGIIVKVIAQGTGQALDTGRRGDADVVFVPAKAAELQFLSEGESLKRYPVMYNDFGLIGPKTTRRA
jgi:hypothetical protein